MREKWGRKTLNETGRMCIERGMGKEDIDIGPWREEWGRNTMNKTRSGRKTRNKTPNEKCCIEREVGKKDTQ